MDALIPAERSARKARVKGKGSSAEMAVRRLVHRMGYGYRLHGAKLPGRPDLVFPGARRRSSFTAVSGIGTPIPRASWRDSPKRGRTSQVPKLEGNRARDLRQLSELQALGWSALTLWECELKNEASLENEIRTFLDS